MKTVQDVFNLAIEKNYFNPEKLGDSHCTPSMVMAISALISAEEVTPEEGAIAIEAIDSYVMQNLNIRVLVKTFEPDVTNVSARVLEIYKDWDNRPHTLPVTVRRSPEVLRRMVSAGFIPKGTDFVTPLKRFFKTGEITFAEYSNTFRDIRQFLSDLEAQAYSMEDVLATVEEVDGQTPQETLCRLWRSRYTLGLLES